MKRLLKYSLIAFGLLLVLAPFLYLVALNAALREHAKEDTIVYGSIQLHEAINDYIGRYGDPPLKLENLVPDCIDSIPDFPQLSRVDYYLSADGKEWTLDVYWTDRKTPLVFRRSSAGLTPEDTKRYITTRNGCYVLKAG